MRLVWNIIAIVCVLLGAVWFLQGSGVIGGSVMTGQTMWLWIGAALAIAAIAFLAWFNLRRR